MQSHPQIEATQQPEHIHLPTLKGISSVYVDISDPVDICQGCTAILWHAEVTRGYINKHNEQFALCYMHGKVQLPLLKDPPSLLFQLYHNQHPASGNFIHNIRQYNMMFSFMSMGGKVDSAIIKGRGPYVFRLHGQNCHSIGSLLPPEGSLPKFSQLYIYDTENEVTNRLNALRVNNNYSSSSSTPLDAELISLIQTMLDKENELVKSYRMLRDRYASTGLSDLKLRLIGNRKTDGRTYNLPTASEVAVLVGDVDNVLDQRDILVETQTGRLKRINELHPTYLPLQYPLLFPYGEDGYRVGIRHRNMRTNQVGSSKRSRLTMREFFAYRLA